MEYLKQASSLILTPYCFDEYFTNFNFLDVPCFKATLSKSFGLGIILGSAVVKLPQITKIYTTKSGEGISISSITLDLLAVSIYMSYSYLKGFPFSTWGDTLFLAAQTVIIGFEVLHYERSTAAALCYILGYSVVLFVLAGGLTSVEVLWALQGVNIPILLAGKLTQAYVNYKNGHTGQLSAVTLLLLLAGTLARIFTCIYETGDFMSIVTYIASSAVNAVMVAQLFYYWNVKIIKEKKVS